MNYEFIHADCLEHMPTMPNKSVDLVVTDIPYGEVNRKSNGLRNLNKGVADVVDFDLSDLLHALCRLTRGSIYIFCGTEQVSALRAKMVEHGLSTRLLIWEKTNPSPMNGSNIWLSGIECCVYGKFHGAVFNGHCLNSVLRFPTQRGKLHPTQKPLGLMEMLVTISSNLGDTVFDPFMGSGTTGVAALKHGRKFIGVEKNLEYFNKAVDRVNECLLQ